jgi:hypothetical protein
MSGDSGSTAGPAHRAVETGVALFIMAFALVVIVGSLKVGVGWDDSGPQSGFFPFYVALFILVSSIVNLVHARQGVDRGLFVEWGQLGRVLQVAVPTAVYVLLVPWAGIYLASALLIATFMRWLGRYRWGLVAAVSVLMPVATFIVFERWFLVPLPKGPIEHLLGY